MSNLPDQYKALDVLKGRILAVEHTLSVTRQQVTQQEGYLQELKDLKTKLEGEIEEGQQVISAPSSL